MTYNPKPTLIIKKRQNPLDSLFKERATSTTEINDDEKRSRFVGINVSPKLYKELKKCATEQTRTVSSTVTEVIKLYIKYSAKGEN